MQTTVLKAIFAIATFLVCLFAGCLPLSLFQSNVISWQSAKAIRVLRGLLAISLGAFLGICFVGLFPSVQESQDELQSYFKRHLHYPFAEVSILISYFVFWLSAELSKLYFESKQKPEEEQELKEKSSGPTYDSVTSCHDVASHDGSSPMSYFDLVLIVFSLSIKSVLESVAIGTLSDHVTIVQMGSAKLVHESICTLIMAINLANAFRKSPTYFGYMTISIFAVVNGGSFFVGIGLGSSTSGAALIATFILKALAGGAMMTVVMTLFMHLNKPSDTDLRTGVKFSCVLFGFLVFAAVRSIHNFVRQETGLPSSDASNSM